MWHTMKGGKSATRGCILEHINRHTLETIPRRSTVVIGQWQSKSHLLPNKFMYYLNSS